MSMQFATLGKMPFGGRNELRKSFRILSHRILRAAGICWDGLIHMHLENEKCLASLQLRFSFDLVNGDR